MISCPTLDVAGSVSSPSPHASTYITSAAGCYEDAERELNAARQHYNIVERSLDFSLAAIRKRIPSLAVRATRSKKQVSRLWKNWGVCGEGHPERGTVLRPRRFVSFTSPNSVWRSALVAVHSVRGPGVEAPAAVRGFLPADQASSNQPKPLDLRRDATEPTSRSVSCRRLLVTIAITV
jgi:hypothetical protein